MDRGSVLVVELNARPVPQPRYEQSWSSRGKRQAYIPPVKDPVTGRPKAHPIHAWKQQVAMLFRGAHAHSDWPLKGDVAMGFEFRLDGPGDLDNLIKGVKDALNGILYVDDRQVRRYLDPTLVREPDQDELEGVCLVVSWG